MPAVAESVKSPHPDEQEILSRSVEVQTASRNGSRAGRLSAP